jgi:hypothetical protein
MYMSLDYMLDKIEDYENVCWLPAPTKENPEAVEMNPVTHALIFATIAVGIGKITKENVAEFAARFRMLEKIDGAWLAGSITDVEFRAHIGLATNVSNETRAQWAARHFGAKPNSKTSELVRKFERANENVAAI